MTGSFMLALFSQSTRLKTAIRRSRPFDRAAGDERLLNGAGAGREHDAWDSWTLCSDCSRIGSGAGRDLDGMRVWLASLTCNRELWDLRKARYRHRFRVRRSAHPTCIPRSIRRSAGHQASAAPAEVGEPAELVCAPVGSFLLRCAMGYRDG